MGMFDEFEVGDCFCPYCDSALSEQTGQTKCFGCVLDNVKIGEKPCCTDACNTEFDLSVICTRCEGYFWITGMITDGRYKGIQKGSEEIPPFRQNIDRRNYSAYAKNKETWQNKYAGNVLIIHEGNPVAYGPDYSATEEHVKKKYPGAEKSWLRIKLDNPVRRSENK